jgi:hypothetical protein
MGLDIIKPPKKSLYELIVLEYSPSQDAFHRETLQEYIEKAILAAVDRRQSDWFIIAVFENHEHCDAEFPTIQQHAKRINIYYNQKETSC